MIKDAIKYIVGLGTRETKEINGYTYTNDNLTLVRMPVAENLKVRTLTGLVDYIKSNLDKTCKNLLVHVASPTRVDLYSELNLNGEREHFISCEALLPQITFDRFLDTDKFNILLQSSFVETDDRDILLKVCGNVTESAIKNVGDDGVSQAVTMKTGVATLQDVLVPNPVVLAPYRTFQEIEQPESKFIFRMESGPRAAIFEADGGSWRNKCMIKIKSYLEEQLSECENIRIIS